MDLTYAKAILLRQEQFLNRPRAVCQSRLLRWRLFVRRVNAAEVVMGNEQRVGDPVIFQCLAVSESEARKTSVDKLSRSALTY